MTNIKKKFINTLVALMFCFGLSVTCNVVGYGYTLQESVPGILTLIVISLVGYLISWIVPIKQISSVLWISIIAIVVALPFSPISEFVIYHCKNVALMSVVTPILAYAGVIVGRDWSSFKKIGISGIIVSIFVIIGTFLISSLLGDLFMKIFS